MRAIFIKNLLFNVVNNNIRLCASGAYNVVSVWGLTNPRELNFEVEFETTMWVGCSTLNSDVGHPITPVDPYARISFVIKTIKSAFWPKLLTYLLGFSHAAGSRVVS